MSENIEDVKPESVEDKAEEVVATEVAVEATEEVVAEPVEEPAKAEPVDEVISSPEPEESPVVTPALAPVANGVIGSTTAERKSRKAPAPAKAAKDNTVAIHSSKNVSWVGVGKVSKGFNIVSKEDADKWLTRDHIRLVTPEELAKGFGK
jgi:hypothetical protein